MTMYGNRRELLIVFHIMLTVTILYTHMYLHVNIEKIIYCMLSYLLTKGGQKRVGKEERVTSRI